MKKEKQLIFQLIPSENTARREAFFLITPTVVARKTKSTAYESNMVRRPNTAINQIKI